MILFIVCSLIAIASAMPFDAPGAKFMRDRGAEEFLHKHRAIAATLKAPGEYGWTIAAGVVVLAIKRPQWKDAVFVALAPIASGINGLTKWIVGRHRPYTWGDEHVDALYPFRFAWFRDGLPGLFHGKNLSFPSGHACLAFATATALAILWPRYRFAFYAVATVVAIERFAENAHWLSDTVAAAAIGMACVFVVRWFWVRGKEERDVQTPA